MASPHDPFYFEAGVPMKYGGSKPSALRLVAPAGETAEMYAPLGSVSIQAVRSLRLIVRWDNGRRGNSFNNGLCRTVASLTSGRGADGKSIGA